MGLSQKGCAYEYTQKQYFMATPPVIRPRPVLRTGVNLGPARGSASYSNPL
jgi:hypothetical protein